MVEENKIVIVSDDGDRISFENVTTIFDECSRSRVSELESDVAQCEAELAATEQRLANLRAELEYASRVIAAADADRAAALETESIPNDPAREGE